MLLSWYLLAYCYSPSVPFFPVPDPISQSCQEPQFCEGIMKNWTPKVKRNINCPLDSNFIGDSTKSESCFHFSVEVFEIWSSKPHSTEKARLLLMLFSSNSQNSYSYFSMPQSRMKASLTVLERLWRLNWMVEVRCSWVNRARGH